MKKIIVNIVLLLFVCLQAEKIIPIEETIQRKDQWCWAGCSTPMLNYYGENVSQGVIVEYAYGDSSINQWNWLFGNGDVEYQGKIYNPHGIDQILDHWNTDNKAYFRALTADQWKSEVDAGHPFVIRWGWNSGGGHFVVGMGYLDNGNYQIMDPWFGCGYTVQSYDWVKTAKGGQGNWTHSLTTNRDVPVDEYEVKVAAGSGDGMYKVGQSITIVADEAPEGYLFDRWSGNTDKVIGIFDSVATFTMVAENLIFTALYKAEVVIDTSKLSENLLFIGGWEALSDSYGSFASVDTAKIPTDTTVLCTLETIKDDESAEEWAWSQVNISNDTTYDAVDLVKICYNSPEELRLTLVQSELSLNGVAYGYTIPATSEDTTLYIPISLFSQPDWTPDSLEKKLELTQVSGLTVELTVREKRVPFVINEIRLNGYVEKSVSLLGKGLLPHNKRVGLFNNRLTLHGYGESPIAISIFSLNGQLLYEKLVQPSNGLTMNLPTFSNRLVLLKISGAMGESVMKVKL